jgi:ribonuclease R
VSAEPPRVAVLERRGKFLVAEPFFGSGTRSVVSRDSRYSVGDLVALRSSPGRGPRGGRGQRGGTGRAQVARRIGPADVARNVIEALMVDRGLQRSFDPAVARAAREAAERPVDPSGRRDLRAVPTFTIDPVTARDYDDAISARVEDDGSATVLVHIADVCDYAPARSPVDREAHRRATSVYVPGAVEPMLPSELSNGACSLVPHQDRLTVTVEMSIAADRVRRAAFHRSVIRSDARLEYDQVDRIFAGLDTAAEPWGAALSTARAAAAALGARRAERSALALDSAEPEFSFDRHGNVIGLRPIEQTESHRLIEQLMIAANEQVAARLEQARIPTLFRVHERPEATAVKRLIDQLASLGVPTPPVPRGALTPQQAADLAGEASQYVADWVARTGRGRRALTRLVLRTLKQAYYDHRNLGHAGLQSPSYCHFTSPIRRYPDVICHRALLSTLDGEEPAPEVSWVTAAGPWCSSQERDAMTIERDADDIARCFLLERELFEAGGEPLVFEGEVVGLIGAGAFVAFGPRGEYEGMLPVRRLRGDWWELNDEGTVLVGTRRGGAIRLADTLEVQVGSVDVRRGRVDLLPVTDDEDQ